MRFLIATKNYHISKKRVSRSTLCINHCYKFYRYRKMIKREILERLSRLLLFFYIVFLIGCSAAGTSIRSSNPFFAPRTYNQNYYEIFGLATKVAHQTFPDGYVYADFQSGVITVDNPSFWTGDTRLKIVIIKNRDDTITLNVTSKGYGFNTPLWNKSYGEVKRYLEALDKATEEYFREKKSISDVKAPKMKSEKEEKSVVMHSIYDDFLSAVVVIRSSIRLGTGFFVTKSGYLVTNHHVIGSDHKVSIKLRNGKVLLASVVAVDAERDLALLSVKGDNFPNLQLANLKDVSLGKEVLAIGTPEGLSWSITKGIVSAVREYRGIYVIQTDAPINPGNSGGPLIDIESGLVIGINTFGFRKDITEGLNFAIAANGIKDLLSHYIGIGK